MKSRSIGQMVLFCIIATLLLGGMIFIAARSDGNMPAYSVLNKGPQGFSVYMETLKELDVDVQRIAAPVDGQPPENIQVVTSTWWIDSISPEIKAWVKSGGILVVATINPQEAIEEGARISSEDGIETWELGGGKILMLSPEGLTNRGMVKDTEPSWNLTFRLAAMKNRPICFNEIALFPEEGTPSLWSAAPLWLRLLVFQILLVASAWFWMKGRRLGKALPYVEETERTELEYLNSAAMFYQAAGCWRLMLDIYFKSLLHLLGSNEEDWLELWKREKLPELNKAEDIGRWMGSTHIDATPQEIKQRIMAIEHLKNLIKNRRLHPWNSMKTR